MTSVIQVTQINGDVVVGKGEVLFDPSEEAVYVYGDDGTHTVFNFRAISHYTVAPRDDESDE